MLYALLSTQKLISPRAIKLLLAFLPEKVTTLSPISLALFAASITLGDSPLTLINTSTSPSFA